MKNLVLIFALFSGMLALNSCSLIKTSVTPYGGTITEQISKNGYYLQEDIAIHTAPFQNDTAAILLFGPDSVTNALIQDIAGYVKARVGGK